MATILELDLPEGIHAAVLTEQHAVTGHLVARGVVWAGPGPCPAVLDCWGVITGPFTTGWLECPASPEALQQAASSLLIQELG
jgi:hypothetical protein